MTVPPATLTVHQYGDAGVLVDVLLGDDAEDRWEGTQALGDALRRNPPVGLVDVVASFASVFVAFDPLATTHTAVEQAVLDLAGHLSAPRASRRFVVPVVYGGSHGPDLDAAAETLGLTPAELVELHTSADWVVRFVGSPAGAPLMDGPALPASLPRLSSPRARVAPGSVGLSGAQSIVYNAASPGGWQLVGRTPVTMFDLDQPPHVAYLAGDRIRFRPVRADSWDRWLGHLLSPQADEQ